MSLRLIHFSASLNHDILIFPLNELRFNHTYTSNKNSRPQVEKILSFWV